MEETGFNIPADQRYINKKKLISCVIKFFSRQDRKIFYDFQHSDDDKKFSFSNKTEICAKKKQQKLSISDLMEITGLSKKKKIQ